MRKHVFFQLVILVIVSIVSSAYAQNQSQYWLDGKWPYEKSTLKRHDEALYGRLDNGFRYIIQKGKNHKDRIAVQLVVQTGSLMEQDNEKGVAHYLEHLAFNGSKNFPAGELIPFFQANGMSFGRDANAYTSMSHTAYTLNILDDQQYLDTALLFMRDVADGILITPEEVEKERGVIVSEKNSRDSEQFRVSTRIREFLYPDTQFQYNIIGTDEVITTVNADTIKAFYDAWYQPEYMILVIVGNVDPQKVEAQIQKDFSDIRSRAPKRNVFPLKGVTLKGVIPYYDNYKTQATSVQIQAQHPIIWEDDSINVQEKMFYRHMAQNIVSKRLQHRIIDKKAAYLGAGARYSEQFGFFPTVSVMARTEPETWKESFEQLQNSLRVALEYGFTSQEVEDAKKEYLLAYEKAVTNSSSLTNDSIAQNIVYSIMSNRVYQSEQQSYDIAKTIIEKATPEILIDEYRKLWDASNRLLSVTGNVVIEKDPKKIITTTWDDGLKKPIEALEARKAFAYPYVARPKKAGTIKASTTTKIKGSDLVLEEVTFANGLVLRMIPTPYSAGTMSFSVHIGSGSNGISDDDYVTSMIALDVDGQATLGNLTFDEARLVRGTEGVSVSVSLDDDALILGSSGQSKDFAKLLEGVWTQYRDPTLTEQDRSLQIRQYALSDKAQTQSLAALLRTAGRKLFWGESVRNIPISEEEAQKRSVKTLQDTLKKLYSGGSPVINVVGDINRDETLRAVGELFAADDVKWPTSPKEAYKTIYSFAKDIPSPKHVEFDSELDQANVRHGYYRPLTDPNDRKTYAVRRLAASLLDEELREVIREKFGASYSPSAMYWMDDNNSHGLYILSIETQEENFEQMQKELGTLAIEFAKKGVDKESMERLKKPMLGGWTQYTKANRLYSMLLYQTTRSDRPYFEWNSNFPEYLQSITVEDVNKELKEALVPQNRAILTGITKSEDTKQ